MEAWLLLLQGSACRSSLLAQRKHTAIRGVTTTKYSGQLTYGVETRLVTRKLLSVLNRQARRSKHWASVGPSLLVFKGVMY